MTLKSTLGAVALCGLLAGIGSAEAMPIVPAATAVHPALVQKAATVVVTKRVVRRPRVIVRKTIVR